MMLLFFFLDWFLIIVTMCNNYYKNRQVNTWRFVIDFSHSLHWPIFYCVLWTKFCTITQEKTQPLHDAVVYLYFFISDSNLSYSTIIAGMYHFFNNQTFYTNFIKGGSLFWKGFLYLWSPELLQTKCESSLWCYFFFSLDWFLIIVIMCNNYYKNCQVNTWRFVTNFSHSLQ